VATVNRVDVLASWNFKHIVNLKRVHGVQLDQTFARATRFWKSAVRGSLRTMPKKTEKKFDSVQLMRDARERISQDIAGMTFEQEKAYIRERLQRAREGKDSHPQEHAA
jgi:hypothetical protein